MCLGLGYVALVRPQLIPAISHLLLRQAVGKPKGDPRIEAVAASEVPSNLAETPALCSERNCFFTQASSGSWHGRLLRVVISSVPGQPDLTAHQARRHTSVDYCTSRLVGSS